MNLFTLLLVFTLIFFNLSIDVIEITMNTTAVVYNKVRRVLCEQDSLFCNLTPLPLVTISRRSS